jgi:hypothetical protein
MSKRIPEVMALHLCADNDSNGNPRRCFVVLDKAGRHVETIDEGYAGDGALYTRWPMFHFRALGEFAGVDDVTPREYKRWLKREPYEDTESLRKWADRAEQVATR